VLLAWGALWLSAQQFLTGMSFDCCRGQAEDGKLSDSYSIEVGANAEKLDQKLIDSSAHVFEVLLTIQKDFKLGLDLEFVAERKVLPVKAVTGHSAMAWNRANAGRAIRQGDRIVDVGGVRGRADQMLKAFGRASEGPLKLGFVRLASEGPAATGIYDDEAHVEAFQAWCSAAANRRPSPAASQPSQPAWPSQPAEAALQPSPLASLPATPASSLAAPSPLVESSAAATPPSSLAAPSPLVVSAAPQEEETRGSPEEASHDLPAPWTTVWSSSRQKYYFYNPMTEVSTWTRPAAVEEQSRATTDAFQAPTREASGGSNGEASLGNTKSASEAAVGVPPPWQAVWSKTRKKYFYYNRETRENVWQHPAELASSEPLVPVSSHGGQRGSSSGSEGEPAADFAGLPSASAASPAQDSWAG